MAKIMTRWKTFSYDVLGNKALNWRSCDLGQLTEQSLKQWGIQVVHHLD